MHSRCTPESAKVPLQLWQPPSWQLSSPIGVPLYLLRRLFDDSLHGNDETKTNPVETIRLLRTMMAPTRRFIQLER